MPHLQRTRWLPVAALLSCCTSPGTEKSAAALKDSPDRVAFQDTTPHTTIVLATTDTPEFFPLLQEKTLPAFLAAQGQGFTTTIDTIINDERGVFLGQRLHRGTSYIQWLDSSKVTRALIVDASIRLTHGLHVGLTKRQVQQQLGLATLPPDTVSFDTGYVTNHCTLFFHQNRLHTVSLEDLPD
jgi:hypothetical protein